MKKIFRHFIPLIVAFLAAFIFFLGYNHYLLDTSLANLKISLNDLDKATTLSEVKKITAVLDDSFLNELTKGDFDLAFAAKLELSQQMIEQGLKGNVKTKDYVLNLSSAANVDFSAVIADKISNDAQIGDIKYFVKEAVNKEVKNRPILLSFLDNIAIKLFPGQRKVNTDALKSQIVKLEKNLSKYKGDQLQDKYLEVAKLYLSLKDWANSEQYFKKSIEVNPDNERGKKAEFFLGVLYKVKKDFAAAAAIFNKIKDGLPKQWKLFAYYQEADCLYRLGQIEKSIALFEELYKLDPSFEIPQLSQFRAGYSYLYDLKNPKKAQDTFNRLKVSESDINLEHYIKNKIDPDMAWQYCKVGFRLIEEGYKMSLDQKYLDALNEFDLALDVFSKHSTSYVGKALCYYFLKKPEEAVTEGTKAISINPHDYEAVANLGFIYFNLNRIDEAIGQYRQAVEMFPLSYIYNYNLATLYIYNERYDLSEKYFKKVLSINPKYTYAYNNLGYVLWEQGKHNEAKSNFLKAISLNPEYVDAHYNLGIVYFILGNYEEARGEFMEVESLRPKFRQTPWYLKEIDSKLRYKGK